jgi:tetratricopeptide (TPR) repeat protein
MNKNTVLVGIAALLAGFIGGFVLANKLNGSEIAALRSQVGPQAQPNSNQARQAEQFSLSDDEIRTKIAEADRNPTNFAFQKDLGIALYRYAAIKQDIALFQESIRILERADSINNRDFDVLVAVGNGHFDIGFAKKELASFQKAREIYGRALAVKPGDADVQADVGISYFVQDPPDYAKAAAELQEVIDANPRHTRSMQFLAEVLLKQNKLAEAEKLLAKLREIDPNNNVVPELASRIEAAKGSAK